MDQSVFFQEEMCMSIPGNTCACTLQNYPIHKHTYERCHTEKLPTTEICAALVRPQDIKPEVYPWPAGVRDGFAVYCSLLCMPSCPQFTHDIRHFNSESGASHVLSMSTASQSDTEALPLLLTKPTDFIKKKGILHTKDSTQQHWKYLLATCNFSSQVGPYKMLCAVQLVLIPSITKH